MQRVAHGGQDAFALDLGSLSVIHLQCQSILI
jgi:hypothetical protein